MEMFYQYVSGLKAINDAGFVHKDIKTNELVKNEINFKKQNYKIKRRLKKMKKETRRRKKRKHL